MLVHLMLLVPVSYGIFVFTAGSFNPFVIVKGPLKKRSWRLGRSTALASLVAGVLAVVMLDVYNVPLRSVLPIYLLLFGCFVFPSIVKYRRNSIWR